MRVLALNKGYFGGMIRETGDVFDVPDALMADAQLRPSWVEPADGSKLDDGDEPEPDARPKTRRGRPPKVDAESGLEAPQGNGVVEALGGPAPDWLPQATT